MRTEPYQLIKPSFPPIYRPFCRRSRFKAAYGGRGAGRSHTFASLSVLRGADSREKILCCREIQKSIKDSVYSVVVKKIEEHGLEDFYRVTESSIRGENGTEFIFAGLRDMTATNNVKSMEGVTIAWVEEANTVSQTSLDVLEPTIREEESEIWASWNPKNKTDPIDAFFRGGSNGALPDRDGSLIGAPPDSIVIRADYKDNPFFPEVLRKTMEWHRNRDRDKYAWVWLGQYLKRSDAAVFKHVRVERMEPPDGCRPRYGADWGFSVDPTVLVEVYIWDRTMLIRRAKWGVGVEIDDTPRFFGSIAKGGAPDPRVWRIIADSARPETISYMQRNKFPKIVAAKKGAGSVEEGIKFMQNFDIVIHPDCPPEVADEVMFYSYKVDKLTDDVTPELDDDDNNTIDAARYAVEDLRRSGHYGMLDVL